MLLHCWELKLQVPGSKSRQGPVYQPWLLPFSKFQGSSLYFRHERG